MKVKIISALISGFIIIGGLIYLVPMIKNGINLDQCRNKNDAYIKNILKIFPPYTKIRSNNAIFKTTSHTCIVYHEYINLFSDVRVKLITNLTNDDREIIAVWSNNPSNCSSDFHPQCTKSEQEIDDIFSE